MNLESARESKESVAGVEVRQRIFYGWWVVLAAIFGGCLGPGPIVAFSFGVFVRPLSHEFHVGRAAVSVAFSLFNLALAAGCPVVGRLADRYGARRLILICTVAFSAILISGRILSANIWQLCVFYTVLGFVSSGAVVLYSKVISQWFDRQRGLALGVMMCGFGFGAIAAPLVGQRLIAISGWRAAYAILGSAVLLVAVPMVTVFLKERPQHIGLLPDGDSQVPFATRQEARDPGLSWPQIWHSRAFWLMLAVFTLISASLHACFIHMPAMLVDRGATARAAALASSVLGAGMVSSRLLAGYLFDRLFAPFVAAAFFSGVGLGIALLRLSSATEIALMAAFLVGMGLGAEGDAIAFLTSRYFGLRSFGEVYAYNFAAFILAGALGAYVMGAGYDWTGSYALPLIGFLIATALAVLLMTRLGPYRYGVREDKSQSIRIEARGEV